MDAYYYNEMGEWLEHEYRCTFGNKTLVFKNEKDATLFMMRLS